uniref:Uncharacterized protein LOC104212849 n=1 Tax=Nicotiana sylvestris TaxID=4096 RepID=A0A1U7VF88_NICSY|nr:PREDICTED: uncharacterized protein LOC104212849 [Nicotiana sylvestris]
MQNIFDGLLHKNIECYVDDLVVKSREKGDHSKDLSMVFELLQRYQLRMNPLKYAFGFTSGKFLGFIVRHRRIEIDQAKVDAILKMPGPRDIHELKSEILPYSFTLTQLCSNNVDEYQELILGLEMAVEMKRLQLKVFGNSQLVENQLLGSYEVKKPELRTYHDYAKKLMGWLSDVAIQHVPRKENKKANVLAALASSLTFPDHAQVTICQKWLVPPPNEAKGEENELKYLVAVSEIDKEEWR